MSFRLNQLRKAQQLLEKMRHSQRFEKGIANLSQKRQQMKMVAQNQMKLMRETPPESKHYNLYSMLMIAFGAGGISLMLKYQNRFKDIVPEWMLVEQPHPGDEEKINIGKQSQYYYSQSLYFQALSGWTIIFLKRSRMISPIYYLQASIACLIGTYLTDYYKRPNLKHSLWFLFNMFFGFTLGSYFHQQGFNVLVDALYLIGNTMTVYAASSYYGPKENPGILLTALGSMFFGIFYGVGVLRLFRWGLKLNDWKLYPIAVSVLSILLSWSIYRSVCVQDEYTAATFNPINASLSYQWKQIPQVNAFVDAFYHNHKKAKKQQVQDLTQLLSEEKPVIVEVANVPTELEPLAITQIIENNQEVSIQMWRPLGNQTEQLYESLMSYNQQIACCKDIMRSQGKLLQLLKQNDKDSKMEGMGMQQVNSNSNKNDKKQQKSNKKNNNKIYQDKQQSPIQVVGI